MSETPDIVKRLRSRADVQDRYQRDLHALSYVIDAVDEEPIAAMREAATEIESLRSENARLRKAAQALSDRLEVVHNDDSYRAVWSLSHAHCGGYTGPRYDTELAELRRALTDTGETK
jgi:hypothetical protein